MARFKPKAGLSQNQTRWCLTTAQLTALIRNFLVAQGGVASSTLVVKHCRRYSLNFDEKFFYALRTVADPVKLNDTFEYKLKDKWILPPSPKELPMIDQLHLFRIRLRQSTPRRGSILTGLSNTTAPKLHPRITRSDFLEGLLAVSRMDPKFHSYENAKAFVNNSPVIQRSCTNLVIEQVMRQIRLRVPPAIAEVRDRWFLPNELPNSIHPLLSRARWRHLSDEYWTLLQPSLRLASMFLTTPGCWEWYEHVATGVIKRDQTGRKYIDPPSEQLTKEKKQHAVRRILSNLVETTVFSVAKQSSRPGHKVLGSARVDMLSLYDPCSSRIQIDPDRLHELPFLRRRGFFFTVFGIAKTLLHEIAHVFYYSAHRFASKDSAEPSFQRYGPLSRTREMGKSWEEVSFGGCFQPYWDNDYPITLTGATLADLSDRYPGKVDVGSTDVDDFCQYFTPSTWALKWFARSTWDKIAQQGLDFMKIDATSCAVRAKKDYPVPGWCLAYNDTPHDEYVHAVAWPYVEVDSDIGVRQLEFKLARSQMEDEHGYTVQEREFALAWATTLGKIDMKALLADREVCTKHEKRKREDKTDLPDEVADKKQKMKESETLFTSNYALLGSYQFDSFHKAS